jgi:hypothetical protein
VAHADLHARDLNGLIERGVRGDGDDHAVVTLVRLCGRSLDSSFRDGESRRRVERPDQLLRVPEAL